jgi:hypothetical protein
MGLMKRIVVHQRVGNGETVCTLFIYLRIIHHLQFIYVSNLFLKVKKTKYIV